MNGGLRELWGLSQAPENTPNGQGDEYGQAFRDGMARVNRDLQSAAATASRTEFQQVDAQRARLYEAFQKASAQGGEPAKATQSLERVIAALKLVEERAAGLAAGATAGRDEWLKREADFETTMDRIGELEEAAHPKVATLRKLGDAIRNRANNHEYKASVAAFDQLSPKLDGLYAQHQGGAAGAADEGAKAADAASSCQVTIANNTQAALTLTDQGHERGDFMTFPAKSLAPGASTSFVSVETPGASDPTDGGCKGYLVWQVGSPDVEWRLEWDNPEGAKNLATASVNPTGAGFNSLNQIGQGEENVPVDFTISGAGAAAPVATGSVSYDVTDGVTGQPIETAKVTVAGDTIEGHSMGMFVTVPVGDQPYEVTADGYQSDTGTVTVTADQAADLKVKLTPTGPTPTGGKTGSVSYDVTNAVTGEGIENVVVTIAGKQSDGGSMGMFVTVPEGDQPYEVKAEGYETDSGNVTITADETANLTVKLKPVGVTPPGDTTGALPVQVRDGETGEPVVGAAVEIAGESATTDASGAVQLSVPVGSQAYRASADGYERATGNVEVVEGENAELVIELTKSCDVARQGLTVLVKDKESGDAVAGAGVTVGDQTDTASSNGLATVELPVGDHTYEVFVEGYLTASGSVSVTEGDNPELVFELTKIDADIPILGGAPGAAGDSLGAAPTAEAAKGRSGFIGASVGKGGKNDPEDVKAVQEALSKHGEVKVAADGKMSSQTLKAIEAFQKRIGQFKPSGVIEPNRGAARVLSGAAKMPPPQQEPKPIAPPELGEPSLDKGAFVWNSTRDILNTNIEELKKGVRSAYGAEHKELLTAIDGSLARLGKVVDKLDTRLADALDAANSARDDASRVAELKKAQAIMTEYVKYVKAEPMIGHMDSNPFGVKTSLMKVITDALKHLSQLLPKPPAKGV